MRIDNTEFIEKNILNFDNPDKFYVIKVFVRKKDVLNTECDHLFHETFGYHNERMITNLAFSNMEEYEKYKKYSKYLFEKIPNSRVYLNVNPKSTLKAMLLMQEEVQKINKDFLFGNTEVIKRLSSIAWTVQSVKATDYNRNENFVILDVDYRDERYFDINNIDLINNFKENILNKNKLKYFEYETIYGMHIVLPHKSYGFLQYSIKKLKDPEIIKFMDLEWVDIKENAACIMYA